MVLFRLNLSSLFASEDRRINFGKKKDGTMSKTVSQEFDAEEEEEGVKGGAADARKARKTKKKDKEKDKVEDKEKGTLVRDKSHNSISQLSDSGDLRDEEEDGEKKDALKRKSRRGKEEGSEDRKEQSLGKRGSSKDLLPRGDSQELADGKKNRSSAGDKKPKKRRDKDEAELQPQPLVGGKKEQEEVDEVSKPEEAPKPEETPKPEEAASPLEPVPSASSELRAGEDSDGSVDSMERAVRMSVTRERKRSAEVKEEIRNRQVSSLPQFLFLFIFLF